MKTFFILTFTLLFANLFSQEDVSFTVDITEGCSPLTVNFTNTSTDTQSGYYKWFFNDGTQPLIDDNGGTHTYTVSGYYNLTLKKFNYQDNEIDNYTIGIRADGIDSIQVSTGADACIGEKIWVQPYESGANVNLMHIKWFFGEGDTIFSNYTASHKYLNAGTYNIEMYAETQCGFDTIIQQIEITNSATPIVDFETSGSNQVCINDQISFYPKYPAASYSWDFDDGATDSLRNPNHIFTLQGNKNITLTTTNICGNSASKSLLLEVSNNLPAFANFGFDNYSNCPNMPISFSAFYTGTYQWTFDTISTSNIQNPNVLFADTGDYSVQLILTNGCGNSDTSLQTVSVHYDESNRPSTYINFDINGPERDTIQICPNQEVSFRNNTYPLLGVDYLWNFGDGATSALLKPSHIYSGSTGLFQVSLIATNQCMGKDTAYLWVDVNNNTQPNGQLVVMPDTICPGDNASFIDMGSNSDGEIPLGYNYNIVFGDGQTLSNPTSFSDSTLPVFNHVYNNAGQYSYTFSLTNSCGNSIGDTGIVVVTNSYQNPSQYMVINSTDPNYGGGETGVCINEPVQFIIVGGHTFEWHFGDGTISIDTNFVTYHAYADTGSYQAFVIITNSCGLSDTISSPVTITGSYLPEMWFDVNGEANCPGDSLIFNYGRDGYLFDTYTYEWDFGDETIGNGHDIAHSYLHTGEYNVKLKVTNGCGSITNFRHIFIDGPILDFTVSDNTVLPNDTVVFTNNSTNSTSYSWNFGDTQTSTITSPTHAYENYGYYNVYLVGVSASGCVDTLKNDSIILVSTLNVDAEVHNITCNDGNNGVIIFSIVGGTPPYTITNDENLSTTVNFLYSNLSPNTYHFHITDAAGIVVNKTITITQPAAISYYAVTDSVSCANINDGKITLNVSGGTAPYTYKWAKEVGYQQYEQYNSNANPLENLTTGFYKVTITDVNGCTNSAANIILVDGNGSLPYYAYGGIDACNASNGSVTVRGNTNDNRPIYVEFWDGTSGYTTDQYTSVLVGGLQMGIYSVTITDTSTACVYNEQVEIMNTNATFSIDATSLTNEYVCENDTTGYIDIHINDISGTSGNFTYQWSNNVPEYRKANGGKTIYHLPAGIYNVTVTDNNNSCPAVKSFEVKSLSAPDIMFDLTEPQCYGEYTGKIKAIANDGVSNTSYSYLWNNGAQTQEIINRNAGLYSVTVTSNWGCQANASVTLNNPPQMTLSINSSNVTTIGGNDGVASVIVNNGGIYLEYFWEDSNSNQIYSGYNNYIGSLYSGTYYLTVEGTYCTATGTVVIENPTLLPIDINVNGDTLLCYGETTELEAPSGYNTYHWSTDETTQTITVGETDTYSVTVSDGFQSGIDSIDITVSHPYNDEKICMVTVDTASLYNMVIWEKTPNVGIVSYNIYKLFGSQYLQIGSQVFDDMSVFIDSSSQPNVHADRYKISIVDTCGNESNLSPYHQTMYMGISDNTLGGNTVIILDWDEAIVDEGAQPIDWYYIYKGNTPNTISQVDSVSGVFTGWNDYNANGALYYRVIFNATHACIPTSVDKASGGPYSHSLSNLDDYEIETAVDKLNTNNSISVFPNPFNEKTTVSFSGKYKTLSFKLVDFTGRTIIKVNKLQKSVYLLDGSNLAKGIYFVEFNADNKIYRTKVVVE